MCHAPCTLRVHRSSSVESGQHSPAGFALQYKQHCELTLYVHVYGSIAPSIAHLKGNLTPSDGPHMKSG